MSLMLPIDVNVNPTSVSDYLSIGGYAALKKASQMTHEAIFQELDASILRGRGGAAFPAAYKWRHLHEVEGDPKYIICNADEGEPGTFKDRYLIENVPLSIIEGMTIAGMVFGSPQGYIYLRGEYRHLYGRLQAAIDNAKSEGYLGQKILGIAGFDYDIKIIQGAGAYVCGENTALLNSIEALAGRPRIKPPHLAEVGLYGQPTLVNNVETFANIKEVINLGGKAYRELGSPNGGGTKLICLSGNINHPGVYEIGLGKYTLRELIEFPEFGGGVKGGNFGFMHLGGHSGPIGFEEDLDFIYSYEDLWDNGLAIGSGAIVVMNDTVDLVEYLEQVMVFFTEESCGKCTPCRLGTTRALELLRTLRKGKASRETLDLLTHTIKQVSKVAACGLGESIKVAYMSALETYPEAFEAHLKGGQA